MIDVIPQVRQVTQIFYYFMVKNDLFSLKGEDIFFGCPFPLLSFSNSLVSVSDPESDFSSYMVPFKDPKSGIIVGW